MKRTPKVVLCCLALLACGLDASAQDAHAADPCGDPAVESSSWGILEGKVVRVLDGDTLTVSVKGKGLRRVHLNGIDAPEPGRPYGDGARRLLESLVGGKLVNVWVKTRQAWGRTPAEVAGVVRLPSVNHVDVNLLLVQSGLARHKTSAQYSMSNYSECHYVHAEKAARAARRGLWRDEARTAEATRK